VIVVQPEAARERLSRIRKDKLTRAKPVNASPNAISCTYSDPMQSQSLIVHSLCAALAKQQLPRHRRIKLANSSSRAWDLD